MKEEDEVLAVKAAELYYQDDRTQDEIGALLGVTRWKVGRLLQQAKDRGFIRIEIVHPRARRLPLERRLRDAFGLRDAVVVPDPGPDDPAELADRVALAAAEYLTNLRPVPRTLGISWGRTLHDIARHLPSGWASGVDVVQVNGGVSVNRRSSVAASTAVMMAQKAGGEATLLPSPAILERAETRHAIESDRTVRAVLERGRAAAALLFSAGPVDSSSVHIDSGYLTADEIEVLREKGAVGDVLGRYIDADGRIVDPALDDRTLGLGLQDLRSAPISIAVIAGAAKRDICRIVVETGLCSVLVTDEQSAEGILRGAAA